MMANSVAELVFLVVAGSLLGLLHFGGLLWTVERLRRWRYPLAMTMLSSAVRCLLLSALLLYLSRATFWPMLSLIAGVGIGRQLVIGHSLRSMSAGKGGTP